MIHQFFKKILEIIFPNRCLSCNKLIGAEGLFCNADWQKLQFITEPKCKICSYPFEFIIDKNNLLCSKCLERRPFYDKSITLFRYNEQIKKIIGDLKYRDATHIIKKFAKMLEGKILAEAANVDFIVAVPLHKKRLRERKFNQAWLLAREIFKIYCGVGTACRAPTAMLLRTKYTHSQVGLKKSVREKNLHNAFALNPKYRDLVKGRKILLIDDVMTTGTTLEQCAKILKKAGAQEIIILTIAKTILN